MKGKKIFTSNEANQISFLIKKKLKADSTSQKSIRNNIRKLGFYASDFGLRGGYTVADFLNSITISSQNGSLQDIFFKKNSNTQKKNINKVISDESYIINLCDKLIKHKAIRQHRFDFLKGDSGVKLPVDAFYPKLNLVIEYMEKQHSESVIFFDKRKTVSGVSRGEQRRIYDARRRKLIPKNGINLITLSYVDFEHTNSKRLVRNCEDDMEIINNKFKKYL